MERVMIPGCMVSAGPAPIPLRTQAPIKEPYVVALARQIIEAKQMIELQIKTARRPKLVEIGTQMKLENPRTRIHTPVFPNISKMELFGWIRIE
jgi:hypothetical protein